MESERNEDHEDYSCDINKIGTGAADVEHIEWALSILTKGGKITMPSFVKAFLYTSEQDAHLAYSQLISSPNLTQPVRLRLKANYRTWRNNHASTFWAQQTTSLKAKLALVTTAGEIMDGSQPIANKVLQEESETFVQSPAPHHHSSDFPFSSTANRKHPRDTLDNDHTRVPKTFRNRSAPSLPTPAASTDQSEGSPLFQETEYDAEDDEDGLNGINFAPFGRMPTRPVSRNRIATSLTNSKGAVSGLNWTTPFVYDEEHEGEERRSVGVYKGVMQTEGAATARSTSSTATTRLTPASSSSSSSLPLAPGVVKKREKSIMQGGLPLMANNTIGEHNLSIRNENVQTRGGPSYTRPRCIGSPSPLPNNVFPLVGSSELPPAAYSPEGLQYAVLNQRTHWLADGVDIGKLFEDYKQGRRSSLDIAQDDIIDLTADSPFLHDTSDAAFGAIIADFPTNDSVVDELVELTSALGETCSFEQFQDRVFNVPPNTPIRRFIFRILDSYSRYFPKHKDVPHLLERQAMFDLLCPFIRGALLVYDIESDISEIAIVGSGVRKNLGKEALDKLSKCRLADITGNDGMGHQVFLAECSKIYEKDTRKFKEDRWKLARAMKDSWDLAVRKLAENHCRPHEDLSVYGMHFFDDTLVFLKLDYCGHYRLWQVDTAQLPMRHHDFFNRTVTCCKIALRFAAVIAKEIDQRKTLAMISPAAVLALSRAARNLKRTTDS
ncbi:hypothetical protein BGZ83_005993 [Gryganskiella cystojenkinii]|nr:hypothetical protein BGZ83_005993 [Gryganskiella cystojenkinii]